MLAVPSIQVSGLKITGVGAHEMRELECDAFLHADLGGSLQLEQQLFPFNREAAEKSEVTSPSPAVHVL